MKPHINMMCAAPYMDEQEAYYRARVEKLETQTCVIRGIPKAVRTAKVWPAHFSCHLSLQMIFSRPNNIGLASFIACAVAKDWRVLTLDFAFCCCVLEAFCFPTK